MISEENNRLVELYKERADIANQESNIQEMKKYVWENGLLWKILNWVEKKFINYRKDVQREIEKILSERN